MVMWVAAGYGIGITAQSRVAHARAWGLCMRPFANTPFEVVTHLLRLNGKPAMSCERFAHRALRVAKAQTD